MQLFTTRAALFEALEKINPKFDAVGTSFTSIRKFGIKDKEGNYTHCGGFKAFVAVWNSLFGKAMNEISFQSGKVFYIKWEDGVSVPEDKKEKVEDGVQEQVKEKEELQQEQKEELVTSENSKEEVISLISTEEAPEDKEGIDWEYVDSIKNNKYGKQDLEKYARDNFDVELDCRRSLANMKKDLKEAVES